MSIHPSLRVKAGAGALRNVLKRYERVRHMMTNNQWTDGQSVFGLPKIKQLKMKSRKTAKEKPEEGAAAPGAAATPPAS